MDVVEAEQHLTEIADTLGLPWLLIAVAGLMLEDQARADHEAVVEALEENWP